MTRGTLYLSTIANEPLRTRVILVKSLVTYFNLPFTFSDPDDTFPSKFTANRVPAMQWEDGTLQEESIPIVLALSELAPASAKLLGEGLVDRSQILQWMCKFNYEVMPPIVTLLYLKMGRIEFSEKVEKEAWATIKTNSEWLDGYFATHEYLVRNELTVADLYGATFLYRGLNFFFDAEWRARYPHLMRWWQQCAFNPIFGGFFETLQLYDSTP